MVDEAMAAQHADVSVIKKNRGGKFKITDAKLLWKQQQLMKPIGEQAQSVFDLHTNSVEAHYKQLTTLA